MLWCVLILLYKSVLLPAHLVCTILYAVVRTNKDQRASIHTQTNTHTHAHRHTHIHTHTHTHTHTHMHTHMHTHNHTHTHIRTYAHTHTRNIGVQATVDINSGWAGFATQYVPFAA